MRNTTLVFFRLGRIPKNLTTVARELFTVAVCLKPRLVNMGLERLKQERNSNDIIQRIEKGYLDNSKPCYSHLALISIISSRGITQFTKKLLPKNITLNDFRYR